LVNFFFLIYLYISNTDTLLVLGSHKHLIRMASGRDAPDIPLAGYPAGYWVVQIAGYSTEL
jgi:hypothetical protein